MLKKINQKNSIKTIFITLIILAIVSVLGQAGNSFMALVQPNKAKAISSWRWTRPPAVFLEQTIDNPNNPNWIIRVIGMDEAQQIRFTLRDLDGNSLLGWKKIINKDNVSYYAELPITLDDYEYQPLGRIIWIELTHPEKGKDYIQYRSIIGKGTQHQVTGNYITDVSTFQPNLEWSITIPSIPKKDDDDKSPAPFEPLSKVNRVYAFWVNDRGTHLSDYVGASFNFKQKTFNNKNNIFKETSFKDKNTIKEQYSITRLSNQNSYSINHRIDSSEKGNHRYYLLGIINK